MDFQEEDHVNSALLFLNAPYLWGGRCITGIDCSGLVQIILMARGIFCARDCKDQKDSVGEAVPIKNSQDTSNLQRGDLVYFKRHVGIMVDDARILNATSRHMNTLIEDVNDLVQIYDGILSVRRL